MGQTPYAAHPATVSTVPVDRGSFSFAREVTANLRTDHWTGRAVDPLGLQRLGTKRPYCVTSLINERTACSEAFV